MLFCEKNEEKSVKIEEIKEEHFDQVKDLLVELQEYVVEIDNFNLNIVSNDYREKYFEFMFKDCESGQGKIFVAVDNEKVMGMIAGFVQTYDERDKLDYSCPKKGFVAELIVSKNARSGGIGTKLLNKMEEYFKSINCEYCQIDVFASNENAKKFYQKKGYQDRMVTMFKKL